MTEGVSSSYKTFVKSNEEKQLLLSNWRARFKKQAKKDENSDKKQVKTEKEKAEERKSPFLSNTEIAERKQPFLNSENISDENREVFLSNDMMSERTSPFLSNEVNPDNKPFLKPLDTSNAESPLALSQIKEDENETFEIPDITFPKNAAIILSELERNPMKATFTARDIANEYKISYQEAIDIFRTLNADTSGAAREFNLPDENATVSYLV